MRQVTDKRSQCNKDKIAQRSKKILHGMAKRQQEIHVAGKMNDACVKEERGDQRESTEPRRLRWNQSETLNDFAQMWKRKETGANDAGGKQPCCHGFRCSSGSSNSTGIPRNAAMCFHDSSGAALSKSDPSACLDNRSTSAIASVSRAFCGSSGAVGSGWRGTSVSTS